MGVPAKIGVGGHGLDILAEIHLDEGKSCLHHPARQQAALAKGGGSVALADCLGLPGQVEGRSGLRVVEQVPGRLVGLGPGVGTSSGLIERA